MPILSNSQNLTITGGQFTDTTITNNLSGPSGIDTLLEASCPEAAHDASGREYSPRCFPGTRKQYIEDIVRWAAPTLGDSPTPVYWMKGPAGVGKSAVAQTCAEELKDRDKLGAAFFFSINGRNKPGKFFSSIAYQLSTIYLPYRDIIDNKIRRDKTLVHKTIRFQFRYLIEEPLRELASQGKEIGRRIAIIVDGLDECEGADAQSEIIHIVAEAASDGTLPLCWAFFSRPEPHIEAAFASPAVVPHCHKVILPISRDTDGEIELYLRNGFENILQRRNSSTWSPWPSTGDMAILVGAARGLFIYATTLLRFVDNLGSVGLRKRLQAVIDIILDRRKRDPHAGTGIDAAFAELHTFYTLILQRIPPEIFPPVHMLLVLMCQWGALGAMLAANLLGLPKDEFETVCHHASAVVHLRDPGKELDLDPAIDTNCRYTQIGSGVLEKVVYQVSEELGGRVSFYHKSFHDFLLDPTQSGNYCVKNSEALTKHYLKMHLEYGRSYCWRGSELILTPGATDSALSLSRPCTNELINSVIRAWAYIEVVSEDTSNLSALGAFGTLGADCDFRKPLHIATHLWGIIGPVPISGAVWGCECRCKRYPGTRIVWFSLAKFDVTEFKLMIKKRQQANIIQRYHPKWPSRIQHLFHDKHREHFESALYRMGHGEKSIFWYWEIDYKLEHYREFRTTDLAKGEKIFRDEDFDSWPESESEFEPDDLW